MPPNARRFSQITDDSSETSISVFPDNRSNTGSTQEYPRKPKRQRTSGLNARFDNMVRTMDATYSYSGLENPRQRPTRTRSSSDASYLSSAITDAYSNLHEGRIGENFALIKMQPLVDGHRFPGPVQQIEGPDSTSQNDTKNTFSVREALPEWLCSTFSTLAAKHPLRLLLPKKPSDSQTDINDHSLDDSESDPTSTFAFNPNQITQVMSNDRSINFVGPTTSDESHGLLSSASRSTTSMNVHCSDSKILKNYPQEYRSPSAACGDSVPLTLDVVPFSTPEPKFPVVQRPTISKGRQVNEQDRNLPSEFEDVAFIPFSTPGPASTLKQCVATNSLDPKFDLYDPDCLVGTESFVCPPRHLASSLLSTSANHAISHFRHASNDSSIIDSCLPPYHAAPSDPAPAYYSDGIYDNCCYADPLTDESGLEPEESSSSRRTDDNLVDFFATPGPGYYGSRPVYFDSPIEEPSDPDHSKSGYEIDLDALDFKWIPFNRKSTGKKILAPDCERRPKSCQSPVPQYEDHHEPGTNCAVISHTASLEPGLLADSLPSPSPFRFTPHQLTTDIITLERTTSNCTGPQILQPTRPAQPFAPAPGIFVSPLRDEKPEAPKTPENHIIDRESPMKEPNVKVGFSSSQGSYDSIQSWRDVDEDCLP